MNQPKSDRSIREEYQARSSRTMSGRDASRICDLPAAPIRVRSQVVSVSIAWGWSRRRTSSARKAAPTGKRASAAGVTDQPIDGVVVSLFRRPNASTVTTRAYCHREGRPTFLEPSGHCCITRREPRSDTHLSAPTGGTSRGASVFFAEHPLLESAECLICAVCCCFLPPD